MRRAKYAQRKSIKKVKTTIARTLYPCTRKLSCIYKKSKRSLAWQVFAFAVVIAVRWQSVSQSVSQLSAKNLIALAAAIQRATEQPTTDAIEKLDVVR